MYMLVRVGDDWGGGNKLATRGAGSVIKHVPDLNRLYAIDAYTRYSCS